MKFQLNTKKMNKIIKNLWVVTFSPTQNFSSLKRKEVGENKQPEENRFEFQNKQLI